MNIRDPPRGTQEGERTMKMHKTILTLLAVLLAVIGTTATVVHGDGPDDAAP